MNQKKTTKRKAWSLKSREEYYHAISQYFIKQRGAPLFLSSREFNLISEWEKANIPLRVVLDGLRQAIENRSQTAGRRSKIFTLNQCQRFVLNAHKQHQERRIGGERSVSRRGLVDKKNKILSEIKNYLYEPPPQLDDLNSLFVKLQEELDQGNWDEELLERTEIKIERTLEEKATSRDRQQVSEEVKAEYGIRGGEEFERIVRLMLIKKLRKKYRIPYISPFYF